eukprot:m.15920 g.15920  ORF g.15920 m.15920 type:complete len:427 (+) comp6842_c0_seq1:109-1389(+)
MAAIEVLPKLGVVSKVVSADGVGEEVEKPKHNDMVIIAVEQVDGFPLKEGFVGDRTMFVAPSTLDMAQSLLSVAVMSMKKGETATFTFDGEFASHLFTEEVSEAPRATITLNRWTQAIPLTEDRGVCRVVTRPGEGDRPQLGSLVLVKMKGLLHNGEVFDDNGDASVALTVGNFQKEGEFLIQESLHRVIANMRPTERCTAIIEPGYAYGPQGYADKVPADATVIYELELCEAQNPLAAAGVALTPDQMVDKQEKQQQSAQEKFGDLTPEQRVARAEEIKGIGNDFFKSKQYNEALTAYGDILDLLQKDWEYPPEVKERSRALKLSVGLNVAASQLQLKQYADVIGVTTELLKQDKTLSKAYFRRAAAHEANGDFDAARKDLRQALEQSAEDVDKVAPIQKALKRVELKSAKQDAKDKMTYQKMFA